MVAVASSVFAAFDKDGDGKVSASELRSCMATTLGEDVSEEEAAAILAAVDADGDGMLDQEEFLRLTGAEADEKEKHSGLREAFGMYTMEGEECITPASLKRMLCQLSSQRWEIEQCRAMICRFDLNGDGVLSFEEFRIMMMV